MTPIEIGLIGLACLVFAICCHIPVGIAMAVVGAGGYLILTGNPSGMLSLMGTEIISTLSNHEFSVIMTFILMGGMAGVAKLSSDIYRLSNAWVGHWKGGLSIATILGCGGFGAISGSSIATTATMVKIAMPEMEKRKYAQELSTGTLAAGGTLGSIVPPSIIMVLYAVQVEEFIIDLFLAAVIPAILSVFLFAVSVRVYLMIYPENALQAERTSWPERMATVKDNWASVSIIVIVMGGIYSGFFTVNEGASVGLILTFFTALMRRTLNRKSLSATIRSAVGSIALLYVIMTGANVFTYFITLSNMPAAIVDWVIGLGLSPIMVIWTLVFMYIALGAVFDAIAGMLLTLPFVYPLVTGLGYDPVWWGIVNVMVIEIGMITPPVGINVFVLKGLRKDIPLTTIFKGVIPFLAANLLALTLVIFFPQLSLWLPNLLRQ
ncbi:TRAP transporter large permease [Desulforhopalus singaporensis]|uniref:TRAP transporter, DctM subunit n=1 Tax=Desulforhopalus singaporensis TaxID=91360 RepID=A0A1H0VM57_9BACT|nr:TRAP transporter large permease [Desulforhopalus singaporensis]SDP79298.1 TRAP transporter, DctM subunit [Desulforhopalus singaporensis]